MPAPVATGMLAEAEMPMAAASSCVAFVSRAHLLKSPVEEPAVQVRSDFRSTVAWQPDVVTDKDGKATVKITYPDSLTGWKATARAVSEGNQFGIANAATRTKQQLIVRLEAPRFLLVGDEVVVSAVVNNNTDHELTVKRP